MQIEPGQFVRVTVRDDGCKARLGYAWGMYDGEFGAFRIIYTESTKVKEEAGEDMLLDLSHKEESTAVDPDAVRTPTKAWVALATYQLTK